MFPLQLFFAAYALGVWWGLPAIERDLASRTTSLLREMDLDGKVRVVRFEGPVAFVRGTVPDAGVRDALIYRIERLESLWGLRVGNPNDIQIVPPSIPVSYRLDFANREIKVTGNVPGELEKKSLNRKVRNLFPKATVMDMSAIVTNTDVATMSLNLLEHLSDLQKSSQLRWVAISGGQLTVSANLPGEKARLEFIDRIAAIGPNTLAEDLHVISPPKFDMKFTPGSGISLSGKLAGEDDQALAIDFVKGLFPKIKVEGNFEFDEQLGPIEWIFPKLEPLPGLQKLGRLQRCNVMDALPLVEAETPNASSRITMVSAIEEAYDKQVRANVSIAQPLITTAEGPAVWADVGEDATPIAITAMNESDKTLILEKLATIFPRMTFQPTVNLKPKLAAARLFLPQLDSLPDILNLESNFVLRGFGLQEGRLKVKGILPDEATRDRFSGLVLRQYSGRVITDLTFDPTFALSEDAYWAVTFSKGTMTMKGQVLSKSLAATVEADLRDAYPDMKVSNELEILPGGLRPGPWRDLLAGLPFVAAPEQTIQISWHNERLALSARTATEDAKAAMEGRVLRAYGKSIDAQIEVVADSALADTPSVTLVDCTLFVDSSQPDLIAPNLPQLQRVADLMQAHPDLKISIDSHTDAKGPVTTNLNTSQSRAEAIAKWLVKRGIAPGRMVAKGFGPRRPVADMKSEAGRDTNRRIEFHVRAASVSAPHSTPP